MSEEQSQNINRENHCKMALLTVLVFVSIFLSVCSLVLSLIMYNGGANNGGNQQASADKNAISKKYDRGKSLDKALKTGKPILVFFYTDWCGYCQRFAPVYDKISKDISIKKEFAVAYVNCEDEKNRQHVEDYKIEGFPTVFVVNTDGSKTQLENSTFFVDKAEQIVTKNALAAIKK